MNSFFSKYPLWCFNIFAILIASRDVFTQALMIQNIDPLVMLSLFFFVTTGAALAFNIILEQSSIVRKFTMNRKTTLKYIMGLGLMTWLSFVATIFGIKLIGAPIFSLIEHSLIPVVMLFFAMRWLGESVNRYQKISFGISLVSLIAFLGATSHWEQFEGRSVLPTGIVLAVLGALLTTCNSFVQKKLVQESYTPDEVLFFRFLIPSFLMALLLPFYLPNAWPSLEQLLKISVLALVGFALPLIFLCFGFVKASFSRFSSFNILIPAYTFLIGPIFVRGELIRFREPLIVLGIVGMFLGVLLFEWQNFGLTKRKSENAGGSPS